MRSLIPLLSLALGMAAVPAGAAPNPVPHPAVFCEEEYALCIIAPCQPIPTAGGQIKNALCSCDVKKGWSMGPGSCASRRPVQKNGRTFLVSTYSNLYNDQNHLSSCSGSAQLWAWCYGATCVVDPHDPAKAICNCPVKQSPAVVLGQCTSGICDQLWSAATPAESGFANNHFYESMQKNHPGVPVNPPATACPPSGQ